MSTRARGLLIVMLVACVVSFVAERVEASAPRDLGAAQDHSLVLYTDGQALVREHRRARLAKGRNRVRVSGLPAGLDASSIRVEAEGVTLIEVRQGGPSNDPFHSDAVRPREAAQPPVIRDRGGLQVGGWVLEADRPFEGPLLVSYLVPAVQYQASLDIVFEESGATTLDGWVSIQNRTGVTFVDARIALMTGPARVEHEATRSRPKVRRREVPLAERVTLEAGQSRRVRVLSLRPDLAPARIVVEGGRLREHEERLPAKQKRTRGDLGTAPVGAELRRRLRDRDMTALVEALPPATRRIYAGGSFGPDHLYEDRIDPESMSPDVLIRPAADVRAGRQQLAFTRRKDPDATAETIELVIANARDRRVEVEIVEHLFRGPTFEIEMSSRDLETVREHDRDLARTNLAIEPGARKKLTYTVVYRP